MSLRRSLTSLRVALEPRTELRFPKGGGFREVVVGVDVEADDPDAVEAAIAKVEAAMTPGTADDCDGWLVMLQAACAKRAESEVAAEVALTLYSAALRQYPADVAKAACMHFALRRGTNWFPALGELLEVADRLVEPRKAMLAALKAPAVQRAITRQREPVEVRRAVIAELMAGFKRVGEEKTT